MKEHPVDEERARDDNVSETCGIKKNVIAALLVACISQLTETAKCGLIQLKNESKLRSHYFLTAALSLTFESELPETDLSLNWRNADCNKLHTPELHRGKTETGLF